LTFLKSLFAGHRVNQQRKNKKKINEKKYFRKMRNFWETNSHAHLKQNIACGTGVFVFLPLEMSTEEEFADTA